MTARLIGFLDGFANALVIMSCMTYLVVALVERVLKPMTVNTLPPLEE